MAATAGVQWKVPYAHDWDIPVWRESVLTISTAAQLIGNTSVPEGWTRHKEETIGTIFAGVFTHNEGKEGVMCFSQEAPFEDMLTAHKFDWEKKLPTFDTPTWEEVDKFVKTSLETLHGKQVCVLGHSFGGAVANLVGYDKELPSLSLDGPGVSEIIEKNRIPLDRARLGLAKTVMIIPNAINLLGKRSFDSIIFSCPKASQGTDETQENTGIRFLGKVRGFVSQLRKAENHECTLSQAQEVAYYTGCFHDLSVFASGKLAFTIGVEMSEKVADRKDFSPEILKSGIKMATAGTSLASTGVVTTSLSNSLKPVGKKAQDVGLAGRGVNGKDGNGISATSTRIAAPVVRVGSASLQFGGKAVETGAEVGKISGHVSIGLGKAVIEVGLQEAASAATQKSVPFFLAHLPVFLEEIAKLCGKEEG